MPPALPTSRTRAEAGRSRPPPPTSLGRRVWIVLAIAGLAACAEAVPNMDAETSGAATTSTSVPALAVVPAPCGEAVVPGGVDDFPEARRRDVACPAPLAGRRLSPAVSMTSPKRVASTSPRRRPRHRPAEAPRPAVSRRQPPGPDTAGARRRRSGPSDTPSIRPRVPRRPGPQHAECSRPRGEPVERLGSVALRSTPMAVPGECARPLVSVQRALDGPSIHTSTTRALLSHRPTVAAARAQPSTCDSRTSH